MKNWLFVTLAIVLVAFFVESQPHNGPYYKPGPGSGGGSGSASYLGAGSGSPEGVIAATPGSIYWDTNNEFQYVKDVGTGNTGWAIH